MNNLEGKNKKLTIDNHNLQNLINEYELKLQHYNQRESLYDNNILNLKIIQEEYENSIKNYELTTEELRAKYEQKEKILSDEYENRERELRKNAEKNTDEKKLLIKDIADVIYFSSNYLINVSSIEK